MTTATDPTLMFLGRFERPEEWDQVIENVPVFKPHTRLVQGEDGKPHRITVTVEDLEQIARDINRLEAEDGVVVRGTEGHTLDPQKYPQSRQPRILSYFKNARVGTYGPRKKPALLMDEFVERGCGDRVRELPFRSAEYYDRSKEIRGVARLLTDPFLDMGLTSYDRAGCYRYALNAEEPDMPDPVAPPVPKEIEEKETPAAGGGENKEFSEQFDQYQKQKFPHLEEMHAQYAASMAPAAGGGPAAGGPDFVSPTNGALPADAKDKEPPTHFSREAVAIQYRRLEQEVQQLKAANALSQLNYQRSESARVVTGLVGDGYVIRDAAREIERMAVMTAAQRAERVEEITTNYQRDPAAGQSIVPYLADNPYSPGGAGVRYGDPTEAETDRAIQYMREHPGDQTTFDKALAEVRKAK